MLMNHLKYIILINLILDTKKKKKKKKKKKIFLIN